MKRFAEQGKPMIGHCAAALLYDNLGIARGPVSYTHLWKTAKSGVTPLKDVYYHIVAVWDKADGTQKIYVDGELKATNNSAGGEFRHMNTNVDKRWFGIGADPTPNDKGPVSYTHLRWPDPAGIPER